MKMHDNECIMGIELTAIRTAVEIVFAHITAFYGLKFFFQFSFSLFHFF
jgi:hypothetical protein